MQLPDNLIDFSIIVCTYNPDERLLFRCLRAIHGLNKDDIGIEVILTDNNSMMPVRDLDCVTAYAEILPAFRIIEVERQGVQFARMAAIEAAKGTWCIYFDYDNEPDPGYLQQLRLLHTKYPGVAGWGPGVVTVDFVDGIKTGIEAYARLAFQQKSIKGDCFASEAAWHPCYPFGTGLCTLTIVLQRYVTLAREGLFTLSGRKANQLSGGEDTQMVLLCIKLGYAAGSSGKLSLTHIIPAERANAAYLLRLAYGTSVCYSTCLLQVFPEQEAAIASATLTPGQFVRRTIKKIVGAAFSRGPQKMFITAEFIGSNAGRYLALNRKLPPIVNRIIKYFRLS
jgi:glycosyltransferase involved in cell wall biosynthesis